MSKDAGVIDLKKGYKFSWVLSSGRVPEVFGHVEKPMGGVLCGTSGWYRTDDPKEAAKIAEKQIPVIGKLKL